MIPYKPIKDFEENNRLFFIKWVGELQTQEYKQDGLTLMHQLRA